MKLLWCLGRGCARLRTDRKKKNRVEAGAEGTSGDEDRVENGSTALRRRGHSTVIRKQRLALCFGDYFCHFW